MRVRWFQRRSSEVVAGTPGVTADTGLRLSRSFRMSESFGTGLQMDYDATRTKDAPSDESGHWDEVSSRRRRSGNRSLDSSSAGRLAEGSTEDHVALSGEISGRGGPGGADHEIIDPVAVDVARRAHRIAR